MRKEVIIAVAAGSILGLVLAFGIWRANIAFAPHKTETNSSPTPQPQSDFKITLAKPQSYQVITQTPITITGITQGGAYVVVTSEDIDYITQADNGGQFAVDTDLSGGVNQIKVLAFNNSGASTQTDLLLVYSSEYAKDQATPAPLDQESSNSADAVRQKVQEKINQVEANPIAALGTITDLTDNTIQMKTQAGEIQLISLDKGQTTSDKENITFIKMTKDVNKEIKFTDLAIGDFIIAMGTKNGNGILHAKRVLITDPLVSATRSAIYGEVVDTGNMSLTLKNPKDGKTYQVEPDDLLKIKDLANLKYPTTRFSQIEQGDTIIAVGTTSKDVFTARTIILTKNAPTPVPTNTPTPKS